ncbi:MAG: phosphoribosyltransferase family protein [Thermodesulfovibrionales bacterium]
MSKSYIERVKEIVTIGKLNQLSESDIWQMLDVAKPVIFDGHFELLSHLHSDKFFRFAALSQYPFFISKISQDMIAWLRSNRQSAPHIDVVLGPSSQGMFFAFDIASKLNTRVAYTPIDKLTGKPQRVLIEGFSIPEGAQVLVVNDMTTTGSGLNTLVNLVEEDNGAKVVGICIFANRGQHADKVKALRNKIKLFRSIIDLDMPAWPKQAEENGPVTCPLCIDKIELIHSKEINLLPIYSKENEFDLYLRKRATKAA